MLRLKRPVLINMPQQEIRGEPVPEKKPRSNRKMQPDIYRHDEFDPVQIIVDENSKLHFSVKRGGDLGLPRIDIRHYMTTQMFEGFTQKGINIPIEMIPNIIETLQWIDSVCRLKGLYYFEDEDTSE
jgi:hypothetical protein